MVPLAACLAGIGGLLLELVILRRLGLLLGNTATASVLTLSLFLLGLGLGGLFWPRTGFARRRPLGAAALLYALVGCTGALGDALLASLPPLPFWAGAALAVLLPGVPAFLMGGAFPLLFAVLGRHAAPWRAGALVGSNLLGSVVAVFVGGNFLIPQLGFTACAWLAVLAYGFAAVIVAVRSRFSPRTVAPGVPPPLPAIGGNELCAFASGGLVLGLEILMLRRLPFFLDGFQPTLSGVLAACLLGLTVGSFVAPPLCRVLFGRRAAAGSVLLAAGILAAGLHESVAPLLAEMAVQSTAALHVRVLLVSLVAAGLPCFFLGATIPLCLADYLHPETRSASAGRLFCFQGIGSLVGAVGVGHALPLLLPESFFLYALPLVGGVAVLLLARQLGWWAPVGAVVLAILALTGVSGGTLLRPAAPVAGSRYDQPGKFDYVEHRTDPVVTASVVYDRSNHGLILFTDQFRAAYIDQDSGYMTVLGHLPFLLRPSIEDVSVIALGTGTTANAVSRWPGPKRLDIVEISDAVVSLVDHFGRQGPGASPERAPFAADPRTTFHVTDGRRYVARAAPGSLDLISMEPLLPYAPGTVPLYSREFYAQCRAALSPRGLMVQWVPTHSMPQHYFETLLATFARGFPHHSVWLVNHSTLLVGSKEAHLASFAELRDRLEQCPGPARIDLHEAGIVTPADWVSAFVGTATLEVCKAPDLVDDRPFLEDIGYWSGREILQFLPDNLEVLAAIERASPRWPPVGGVTTARADRLAGLQHLARAKASPSAAEELLGVQRLAKAQAAVPAGVLGFLELRRARRELLLKQVRLRRAAMPEPFDAAAFGRQLDLRRLRLHLGRDPGVAELWAARALAEPEPLAQHRAMRHALAVDPTFYDRHPELAPAVAEPREYQGFRGPLEDLAVLPRGEDLVRQASGADNAFAVAYRARFRVRVARAFLAVLADRALTGDEVSAFREVLDPFVLAQAVDAVAGRVPQGAAALLTEIEPLWRRDLPMPPGLAELLQAGVKVRESLAGALSGRRSKAALLVLSQLLVDADAGVRKVAAATLFQTLGKRVPYDPDGDEAQRQAAAGLLRRLVGEG